MNRRNFLKSLGAVIIAVPVLKLLPEKTPHVPQQWEIDMAEKLLSQVKERQRQLMAQMFLNS